MSENTSLKSAELFLEHLSFQKILSAEAATRARTAWMASRQPIDIVLTELGLLKEADVVEQVARFLSVETLASVDSDQILPAVVQLGLDFSREKVVLPVRVEEELVTLAVANPFDHPTIDAVAFFYERDVKLTVMSRAKILEICQAVRLNSTPENDQSGRPTVGALEEDVDRLQDFALSAPVVNLVNRITLQAFEENATDIHIEPLMDRIQIRLRKDGLLTIAEHAPKAMLAGIVSRIKILSKLNIVERRLPQDGRMRLVIRGTEVDFRVSIVPSAHGETVVLRLLRNNGVSLDLETLGYEPEARNSIYRLIENPNGIVIVTGPTGSGKTTTLYSLVARLNKAETKIFTVEDPVEYRIDGITQLQVNPTLGLDFATALRSILRQDPDVILVGEIRDRETAQIAIQAALTGHLVLTTLHTNSAVGALTRLQDMGVEPYLTAATIRGIIAQRLVRTYCRICHGQNQEWVCHDCGGTGYAGRTVAYEILELSRDIASQISKGENEEKILQSARDQGMQTLSEHGDRLIQQGRTSPQEVARSVRMGGEE